MVGFAGAYGMIVPDRPSGESAPTDSRVLERSALTSQAAEPSGGDCDIKGNISVNTGERYFCSEAEARAAGWRRSA